MCKVKGCFNGNLVQTHLMSIWPTDLGMPGNNWIAAWGVDLTLAVAFSTLSLQLRYLHSRPNSECQTPVRLLLA